MAVVGSSLREHAVAIVALLDAGATDETAELRATIADLSSQLVGQSAAHARSLDAIQATTVHPDRGAIEIRTCSQCTRPFPEWAGMITMPCPSCRVQSAATRTLRHDTPADEAIAAVAHEAISVHRALHGQSAFPRWEKAPSGHTAKLVEQVRAIRAGDVTSAESSHDAWMVRAKEAGWKYAPTYDVIGRTDPALRPWSELTASDQENRQLFVSVVHTLIGTS